MHQPFLFLFIKESVLYAGETLLTKYSTSLACEQLSNLFIYQAHKKTEHKLHKSKNHSLTSNLTNEQTISWYNIAETGDCEVTMEGLRVKQPPQTLCGRLKITR